MSRLVKILSFFYYDPKGYYAKTAQLEKVDDNEKENAWDTAYYEYLICGEKLTRQEFMDLYCKYCLALDKTIEKG